LSFFLDLFNFFFSNDGDHSENVSPLRASIKKSRLIFYSGFTSIVAGASIPLLAGKSSKVDVLNAACLGV